MKRIVLLVICSLYSIHVFPRIGLSEIFFETPGGHSICSCDPYSDDEVPVLVTTRSLFIDVNKPPLFNVEKFYFYKNHVIGKGKNYYFIFNEELENTSIFKSIDEWQRAVSTQRLDPMFTQWLDISDEPFPFTTPYYIIVALVFIAVILILSSVYVMIFQNKPSWRHFTSILLSVIIIGVTYYLNIYSF